MHEIYELAIESAELDLAVTEGFADKAKSTASKIIEKLKVFIKKFIAFIKDKCAKFIKFVLKLADKLKHLTEMNDHKMINVPKCIVVDESSKVIAPLKTRVQYLINHGLKDIDDVTEKNLDISKYREEIESYLLVDSIYMSVADAKKEILTTLTYIHHKNDEIIDRIGRLYNFIDKLEKNKDSENASHTNKTIAIAQKIISIDRYVISYNNKTLEKCLVLIKKIGNKKIKAEVETSKKIEDLLINHTLK